MTELNFTLQAKERAIQFNPNDVTSKHHLQVLVQVRWVCNRLRQITDRPFTQLRNLVEAGVSQDELSQILAQLRNLARPPTVQPVPPLQAQWPTPQLSSTLTTYPHPSYNTVYLAPTPENFEPAASPAPGLPASAPTENAAGTNLQISNILSSLMKSGLVSTVDTTSEPKAPLMEQEPEEVKPPVPSAEDLTAIKDAQTDYRERILAERVEASSVENSMYAFDLTHRIDQSQP